MNTTLAVLRAENHVSISAITCYLQCPRVYEHRYILGTLPSHRSAALAFGSAIHVALALFYRRLMDGQPEPTCLELEAAFTDAWRRELEGPTPVLLDEGETEDSAVDQGVALIRVFHAQAERPTKVAAVEEPFSIEISDPVTGVVFEERLVGVFDGVVQRPDGGYHILEHKTGARRWSEDRLAFDLQISAYTFAAPMMGFGNADVQVQLLLKTRIPALELYHPLRTDRDRQDLLHLLAGVLLAVQARAFYPRRDWGCRSCPYAGPCLAG
jgi:putative RecB family exonuclease